MAAGAAQRRRADALDEWHRTRWLATVIVNINRGKDDEPYLPTDLLELPGDAQPEPPKILTPEERAAEQALLDQLDADLVAPK